MFLYSEAVDGKLDCSTDDDGGLAWWKILLIALGSVAGFGACVFCVCLGGGGGGRGGGGKSHIF